MTLNYTTTVAVERTLGEVQRILSRHGCASISTLYDDSCATGLAFTLRTPHGDRAFTMPVNVAGVHQLLNAPDVKAKAKRAGKNYSSADHAERVAWRIVKDWLEAQLALIDANMATLDQVMLPYLRVDGDLTLYEAYRAREDALAIGPGS